MPHFIIDVSEKTLKDIDENELCMNCHEALLKTKHFKYDAIQVRLNSYKHYLVGGESEEFIHGQLYLLEGRTAELKREIAQNLVLFLNEQFPNLNRVSVDLTDRNPSIYSK